MRHPLFVCLDYSCILFAGTSETHVSRILLTIYWYYPFVLSLRSCLPRYVFFDSLDVALLSLTQPESTLRSSSSTLLIDKRNATKHGNIGVQYCRAFCRTERFAHSAKIHFTLFYDKQQLITYRTVLHVATFRTPTANEHVTWHQVHM